PVEEGPGGFGVEGVAVDGRGGGAVAVVAERDVPLFVDRGGVGVTQPLGADHPVELFGGAGRAVGGPGFVGGLVGQLAEGDHLVPRQPPVGVDGGEVGEVVDHGGDGDELAGGAAGQPEAQGDPVDHAALAVVVPHRLGVEAGDELDQLQAGGGFDAGDLFGGVGELVDQLPVRFGHPFGLVAHVRLTSLPGRS